MKKTNTRDKQPQRGARSITRAYERTYSDTGQIKAYVEWSDGSRTEGEPKHMLELLKRAHREGKLCAREVW